MAIFRPVGWPTRPWGGFDELDQMRRDMDRLFQGLAGSFREPAAGVFPLTNVTEDDHNYYVRAELPGMPANEIDISVTGDAVSISGERKISSEKKEAKYHRREREAGKFNRMIGLPGPVDTEKVEATCTDGVLTIVIPKAEAAKPKQITVKSA
jgi:HSP20 family protein